MSRISVEQRLDGIPLLQILEGLERLHGLVLVTDAQERVRWMSRDMRALCGGREPIGQRFAEWVRPESGAPALASLCAKAVRGETPSPAQIELCHHNEAGGSVEASAFRMDAGSEDDPYVVIVARPTRAGAAVADANAIEVGAILDDAPDAVIATDLEGYITYANRATSDILGVDTSELLDRPIALFLPTVSGFARLIARDAFTRFVNEDLHLKHRDGSELCLSLSTRIVRGSSGQARGTVSFLRDVTARKCMEEALERKNRELEQYVHTVSHDLRSPLVSLLGFSRLLRTDYQERLDDTGLHFLDRVEQAGRTMEILIQDLLELSRIGQPGERRTMVDPRSILLQLRAELKPRLDEQGVNLVLPANPPLVFSNRTRLYQVFSNLLGNALDHMGPCSNPRLRIEIAEEPERYHIVVSDNGKGVAYANRERIFEIFKSLGARADGRRSTGVGLAIVKKIAETHRGTAWVDGEEGHGARFHVTLSKS
ncbi:MAG: ATP-binding protein [Proteobacteria bacterium]|nr:ATP-binding protein [Pseudomonadota bacterium]